MKALVLKSIQELLEEKWKAQLEVKEQEEAKTHRRWKLDTMNREIRRANKSAGRKEAVTHRTAWGVDQRQFSSETLRQRQMEFQQLREQRRVERQQAVELGRTRIGLDLLPDFHFVLRKSPPPAEDTACPTARKIDKHEAREYMKFKRKRDLNRARLKEIVAERREMQRERALESLEKDCKRGLRRVKTKRKLKKREEIVVERYENSQKSHSLRKRLKELLKEKVESARESSLHLPLSLGSIAKAIEFPVKGEDSSTSRLNSSRRRLRRRAELLQERYQAALDRSSTQEPGNDLLAAVRRDLAARVIQRWYRMHRIRRRLQRRFDSSSGLSDLHSYRDSSRTSAKHSSDLLQRLSLSAVPSAYDSYLTPEEECRPLAIDRFRELLQRQGEGLQLRIAGEQVTLSQVLSGWRSPSVNESLIRTVIEDDERPVDELEPAETEEPDSTRHSPSPLYRLLVISDPPADVSPPLIPEEFDRPVPCFSLFAVPPPQSPKDLFDPPSDLESRPMQRKRIKFPGTALRLEIEEINSQYRSEHVVSPVLSPIDSEKSPEVEVVPFVQVRKISDEEVDEIVRIVIAREVAACLGLVVPKAPASVDISPEFLCYFLELLVEHTDEFLFMREVTKPRSIDLPSVLSFYLTGESFSSSTILSLIPKHAYTAVSHFLCSHISDPEASVQLAAYCRLLYDSANEALDVIRPESAKGERTPWRVGATDLHKYKNIFEVFYDVRDLMFAWGSAEIGRLSRDDGETPAISANIQEERLSTQLLRDVTSTQVLLEDRNWTDYEREETQCRVDIAEGVLALLAEETATLLQGLEPR